MGHPSRILEAGSGLTVSRLGVVKRSSTEEGFCGRRSFAGFRNGEETESKRTPLGSRPCQIHFLRTAATVIADA